MADYITTYSKIQFTPLSPKAEDILIEDIAHALSMMTRANGHFPEFYSVGQHSIACHEEAKARNYSKKVQMACLLHDASEAYISDITRPVKKNLQTYLSVEDILQSMIYEKFLSEPLTEEEKQLVSNVDDTLLHYEFLYYMDMELHESKPLLVSSPKFKTLPFELVEERFLNAYKACDVVFV